jgi:metallo-beta-lactamase class B
MLATLALLLSLLPQASPQFREWNRPIEPFRVAGPLYYVGTENITSLLLTTPSGHVLIDGGLEETAPIIVANVRRLGFRVEDIRVLLSTHAHTDHAGGLARLEAITGARLYAGAADVGLLARGGLGDFAFGDTLPFPPVTADVAVRDGQEVVIGDLRIRAVATPGHTRGCTTWAFAIPDGGATRQVVMIGGTTAPGYRLVGNTAYPGIAADFVATFARLRSLRADIVFEGHGFAFDLEARRRGRRPFVDAGALEESVARAEAAFRKQLAEQKAKRPR